MADLSYDGSGRLGSGRFSTVYRATLRNVVAGGVGEVVVVKDLFSIFDEVARTQLKENLQSLGALRNPNIVQFLGFCEEGEKVLLMYPYHPTGTLAAYLERGPLPYARRLGINNVIMDAHGKPLLSDYGLATALHMTDAILTSGTEDLYRYECPEVIAGRTPYETSSNLERLRDQLHQHALPVALEMLDCPPRTQNVMGYAWKHNPELRPPMNDVLAILDDQPFRFEKVASIPVKDVDGLAFSPDGRHLAVVLQKAIQIISTDTWQIAMELALSEIATVTYPKFSPSGNIFAIGNRKANVQVWNLHSGEAKTYPGLSGTIWSVDIAANDTFAVGASSAGKVCLWQLDGHQGRTLSSNATGDAFTVAISPKCDLVAAGLESGGVLIWDVQTGTLLTTLADTWVRYIQFSFDGSWLFWCNSHEVRRWEVAGVTKKDVARPAVFRTGQGEMLL
ncbi:hypothetical protein FRB99_008532 [Tulasnella sp. 403]|nr:hypothetical protein FRB99_008532 [Tulasnella sp. 403]